MSTSTLAAKLEDLLSSGFTYKAISERAKCAVSTIFRIRTGEIDNPSYSVGTAIDVMHAGLRKKSCTKKTAA
ncbi:hypothetical protein D3C78_1072430 [compost metagenome]